MMRTGVNAKDKSMSNERSVLRIGMYRLGKTLGVGSFGKVKVAEHEVTGHKVAIKILNRSKIKALPRMDEKIQREIQMLKFLRHSHIIKLYEVIETASDIFMIMEYVSGGELFDYIVSHGKLSEDDARRFFQQIISGVDYCHRHRIVHRDLKPENLLLDDSHQNVKIADFGLSNFMQDGDFLTTSCGSPNYAAPEVISGHCGVILYALVCARLPFDDEHIPNLFKKIRLGAYTIPSHVTPGCRSLIMSMLNVDALARATIEDIKAHPWYQVNLPEYLKYTPVKITLAREEDIEEDVLQEILTKFEMTREAAIPLLLEASLEEDAGSSAQGNDIMVAYHLIHDARRMYEYKAFAPGDYETEDLDVFMRPTPYGAALFSPPPLPSPFASAAAVGASPMGLTSPPLAPAVNGEKAKLLESSRKEAKKWYLGIVSSKHPREIMRHVLFALKATGFEWKQVSTYQVRCRQVGNFDDASEEAESDRERGIFSSSSGEDLTHHRISSAFTSPRGDVAPGGGGVGDSTPTPPGNKGRRRERSASSRERSISPPNRRGSSPGREIIALDGSGSGGGGGSGRERRASGESERGSIMAAMMAMMGSRDKTTSTMRKSDTSDAAAADEEEGERESTARRRSEDGVVSSSSSSSSTTTTPVRRGRSATTNVERRGSLSASGATTTEAAAASSKRVKLSIQLFKLTSGRYLLDFKKLGGDTFGFFNCCSDLLVHLSQTITDEKPK
ncbi:protein kinase domain containing protein [Acanthamoeba castellanii str. Neff]|uniref:non-specific serine/threonine protein kinase n=1 Tax=Acanthamoeba castellanii (strain ATCC 30010 / Neff) TaxID=1257118 RepID=L8H795_ACACF|nr:protein kinase domain containing protein [Acanthamoeba castellanii str. Neff]ELR21414.1 protein kinase domain containing protein [Acanthamoeba castellanii str. Neff]